jgi:hypothetical protein
VTDGNVATKPSGLIELAELSTLSLHHLAKRAPATHLHDFFALNIVASFHLTQKMCAARSAARRG